MNDIFFNWDTNKAKQNIKKHKVSFEEASSVFYDEKAIEYFDTDHSDVEDRYLMLGLSNHLRVLVISYNVRSKGTEIRIISARKATNKEEIIYTRGIK